MNDTTITFGKLSARLEELGFTKRAVSGNGTQGYVFERMEEPPTRLYLADYGEEELVAPFDLRESG